MELFLALSARGRDLEHLEELVGPGDAEDTVDRLGATHDDEVEGALLRALMEPQDHREARSSP